MTPLVPKPVFNHDQNGELVQVRWNGDDRGVVGGPAWEGKMDEWFEGVRAWEAILRSEEATLWSKMEMGTAVSEFEPSRFSSPRAELMACFEVFDNHRVLHGRSSFTGERRLCGAYINHDDFRSRLKGLEKQFGEKSAERERLLSRYGLKSSGASGGWADYA
jgi:trimethyllysine dioxygenase